MKWPMGAHGKNESESFSKQGKQEVFIVSWCVTFNIIFKTGFGQFGILLSDSGHVNLSSAYNGSIQRVFIRPEPNYRIFDDLVVVQVTTKVMSDHLLTRRHQFSTYLLGLAGPENGIGENTLLYSKGSKMLEKGGKLEIKMAKDLLPIIHARNWSTSSFFLSHTFHRTAIHFHIIQILQMLKHWKLDNIHCADGCLRL